ncbi:hypothetical protein FQN54_009326 [Arachnomyces sp. PD_36]|nr:hypothetical protein FQN54_009326 [Arachnomyces sp. PD_36]
MTSLSRPIGSDDMSESDASSDVSEVFSNDGSDIESNSDLEVDSEDSDDPDDDLFDEGQLPPEHYLDEAKRLDVSRLRQKRYSDSTQKKLDEIRVYWNR